MSKDGRVPLGPSRTFDFEDAAQSAAQGSPSERKHTPIPGRTSPATEQEQVAALVAFPEHQIDTADIPMARSVHETMTDAQRRALEWLPGDGSWEMKAGRLAAALNSLHIFHKKLIDVEYGPFGPRGAWCARYRLTGAGIIAKGYYIRAKFFTEKQP